MKRMWINDRVAITTTAARWPRKRKKRLKRETIEQLLELEAEILRYLIAQDPTYHDEKPRFVKTQEEK